MDTSPSLSAATIATRLGVSVRSVRRAAGRLGIGTYTGRGMRFAEPDVARLRAEIPGRVGNPQWRRKPQAATH